MITLTCLYCEFTCTKQTMNAAQSARSVHAFRVHKSKLALPPREKDLDFCSACGGRISSHSTLRELHLKHCPTRQSLQPIPSLMDAPLTAIVGSPTGVSAAPEPPPSAVALVPVSTYSSATMWTAQLRGQLAAYFSPQEVAAMGVSILGGRKTQDAKVNKIMEIMANAHLKDRPTGTSLEARVTMQALRLKINALTEELPQLKAYTTTVESLPVPAGTLLRRALSTASDCPTSLLFPRLQLEHAIHQILQRFLVEPANYLWHYVSDDSAPTFRDFNTGMAWKTGQNVYSCDPESSRRLMPLIFYSDETVSSTLGGIKYYPIYMTIANLPMSIRRSPSAWVVLGLIPCVSFASMDQAAKKVASVEYHQHVRAAAWRAIVKDLVQLHERGLPIPPFVSPGPSVIAIPVIGAIIGDHPELNLLAGCSKSVKAHCPCRHCLVEAHNLGSFMDFDDPGCSIPKRQPARVRELYAQLAAAPDDQRPGLLRQAQEMSLSEAGNIFLDCPFALGVGAIFASTPHDILHVWGTGLLKALIIWVIEVIRADPTTSSTSLPPAKRIELLDLRLRLMAPFKHLGRRAAATRKLHDTLTGFLGSDINQVFQRLTLAISTQGIIDHKPWHDYVLRVLRRAHGVAFMVHTIENWTPAVILDYKDRCKAFFSTLQEGDEAGVAEGEKRYRNMPKLTREDRIKFHCLSHLPDNIRSFGCPKGHDAGHQEGLHVGVKSQAQRSAKGAQRDVSILRKSTEESLMELIVQIVNPAIFKAAKNGTTIFARNLLLPHSEETPSLASRSFAERDEDGTVDTETDLPAAAQIAERDLDYYDLPAFDGVEYGKVLAPTSGEWHYKLGFHSDLAPGKYRDGLPATPDPNDGGSFPQIVMASIAAGLKHDNGLQTDSRATSATTQGRVLLLQALQQARFQVRLHTRAIVRAARKGQQVHKIHSKMDANEFVSVVTAIVSDADGEIDAELARVECFASVHDSVSNTRYEYAVLRSFIPVAHPSLPSSIPFVQPRRLGKEARHMFVVPVRSIFRLEMVAPHFASTKMKSLVQQMKVSLQPINVTAPLPAAAATTGVGSTPADTALSSALLTTAALPGPPVLVSALGGASAPLAGRKRGRRAEEEILSWERLLAATEPGARPERTGSFRRKQGRKQKKDGDEAKLIAARRLLGMWEDEVILWLRYGLF